MEVWYEFCQCNQEDCSFLGIDRNFVYQQWNIAFAPDDFEVAA